METIAPNVGVNEVFGRDWRVGKATQHRQLPDVRHRVGEEDDLAVDMARGVPADRRSPTVCTIS